MNVSVLAEKIQAVFKKGHLKKLLQCLQRKYDIGFVIKVKTCWLKQHEAKMDGFVTTQDTIYREVANLRKKQHNVSKMLLCFRMTMLRSLFNETSALSSWNTATP